MWQITNYKFEVLIIIIIIISVKIIFIIINRDFYWYDELIIPVACGYFSLWYSSLLMCSFISHSLFPD